MERLDYKHPFYSKLGVDGFPPLFKTASIAQIQELGTTGRLRFMQEYSEAFEDAKGMIGALNRVSKLPGISRFAKMTQAKSDGSYLFFVEIEQVRHWPVQDPKDKGSLNITDPSGSTLPVVPFGFFDLCISPFSGDGLYSWQEARDNSWSGSVAIAAEWSLSQGPQPIKYTLLEIGADIPRRSRGRKMPLPRLGRRILAPNSVSI